MLRKTAIVTLAIAAAAGLTGCVDDYGYGGIGMGYGAPPSYYGDGYYGDGAYGGSPYDGGYADYGYGGYGYGPSYFGWYGDYYYPGAGYYVYDRYRRPYRWNGDQQRYWSGRQRYRDGGYTAGGNWGGFANRSAYRGGAGGATGASRGASGGNRGGGSFHGGGHAAQARR